MPMGIKISASKLMLEYFSREKFYGQSLKLVFGDNFMECMVISENINPESLMFIIGLNVGGNLSNFLIQSSANLAKKTDGKFEKKIIENIYFSS